MERIPGSRQGARGVPRIGIVASLLVGSLAAATAAAQSGDGVFGNGFEARLPAPPQLRVLRDDHVATLEMDYDADHPWGQFWTMSGSPDDDAGFLVTWWPAAAGAAGATEEKVRLIGGNDSGGGCLNPDHFTAPLVATSAVSLPPGGKWLVTGNRRVQIQPLDNDRDYVVSVQRLTARGRISSEPAVQTFPGGDGRRVAALRASLTGFDDFNLPIGPADERNWNNAAMVSTDPRFNLFFINDQLHAHTLNGTRVDNTGDKSQSAQRFRKQIRIASGARRRIVFDMDSPLSPRSVWYLDLNPIPTEVTGHASFFDEEGALGLPAGILRLRAQFQTLSVSLVDLQGASHPIASVDMEEAGRQAISNVRRHFEASVGSDGIAIQIDGKTVIDAAFAPYQLPPADYELLWVGFGYNTIKDAVPYFLLHWDNFGFDGPVVDARTVHNYVTRIEGTDYQKSQRWNTQFPTFHVAIPDDLRPLVADARAEAWLVYTYQMGDYSSLSILPTDTVQVNGATSYPLPPASNNTQPTNPDAQGWGVPVTGRIKLGEIVAGGSSPLRVGDNAFQFFADNAGILNLHVEVLYPPGSAPAYTPPSALHHFPLHAELPRLGPPARLQRIGDTDTGDAQHLGASNYTRIPVSGTVPLNIEVGNRSWAGWAPQLMNMPVQSTEVWSTGGTAGIATLEVFLRPTGSAAPPGDRLLRLDTAVDAPAPQGRYALSFDSRAWPNGDYDLFVLATTPSGLKSHPSYGNEDYLFDAAQLSGAYYPMPITIANPP
jgi:hypothetical protein